jgi:hypothetical protein
MAVATLTAAVLIAAPFKVLHAQTPPAEQSGSFLTPFPENDLYRVVVMGDGLADGLLGGVLEALGSDPRLQITRRTRTTPPIARADPDEELRQLEDQIARDPQPPHIAVMMLGVQDRIAIRAGGGRRAQLGTPEWKSEYGRRIDRVIIATAGVGRGPNRRTSIATPSRVPRTRRESRPFCARHCELSRRQRISTATSIRLCSGTAMSRLLCSVIGPRSTWCRKGEQTI